MGNSCWPDPQQTHHQTLVTQPQLKPPTPTPQKKKDYTNYSAYSKIKQQNSQMIASRTQRVKKYNTDIENAQRKLQEKIREQTETRKDMSFYVRKIENQIESLTKLRDGEERAIEKLMGM